MKRTWIVLLCTLAIGPRASGQGEAGADAGRVKQDLRQLLSRLDEAMQRRDRAAMEQIYADEFVFIHASGAVVDKAAQIKAVASAEPRPPLPPPDFDDLHVYGDVAVLRTRQPGRLVSTAIYVKKDGRWQSCSCRGRGWRRSARQ